MTPYRAIVIGGTGAVGSALVRELVASPRCSGVTVLGRRALDAQARHAKLSERLVDFDDLERQVSQAAQAQDVAFCTMGVGQPRKVSRAEFERVDVEYAGSFARGCQAAGVRHISLLSSVGADARSRTYYLRVKGLAEEAVTRPGFARASLFRPSLLVTRQIRYGLQDRITQALFPRVSWLLPRRYHQIAVEDLARAMRVNAEQTPRRDGVEVLHYAEFVAILASDVPATAARSSGERPRAAGDAR